MNWTDQGTDKHLPRRVRDGAYASFNAVPRFDRNAAHRDYLHLDIGLRKACRRAYTDQL